MSPFNSPTATTSGSVNDRWSEGCFKSEQIVFDFEEGNYRHETDACSETICDVKSTEEQRVKSTDIAKEVHEGCKDEGDGVVTINEDEGEQPKREAIVASYPDTAILLTDPIHEHTRDKDYDTRERVGPMPLPAQTIAALSENLPWDPEDGGSYSENMTCYQNNQSNTSRAIPIVKEQLIPDVQNVSDENKDTWNYESADNRNGQSYGKYALSSNRMRVNSLTPESAYGNDASGEANSFCFDRRKQRTIRRIDWGTNYIPPLDFVQPRDSPVPIVKTPLPMKTATRAIGKETSV